MTAGGVPGTCVLVLFSIHHVLKAEKLLLNAGIRLDVIPIPRAISSDCGMALEINGDELPRVRELLTAAQVQVAGIFQRNREGSYHPLL